MPTLQAERATFSPYITLTPTEAVPTPIGSIPSKTLTPEQAKSLIHFGNILAGLLAIVLDQLRAYNEQAVYPIVSILEPYMEPIQEIDFHIPPKSSREVIIEVIREGRAVPKIYFDETL